LIIIELRVLKELGNREKIGSPTGLETATMGQNPTPAPRQEVASATSFYGNKPPQPQRTAPVGGGGSFGGGAGAATS